MVWLDWIWWLFTLIKLGVQFLLVGNFLIELEGSHRHWALLMKSSLDDTADTCLKNENLLSRWPRLQFLQPALLSSIVTWTSPAALTPPWSLEIIFILSRSKFKSPAASFWETTSHRPCHSHLEYMSHLWLLASALILVLVFLSWDSSSYNLRMWAWVALFLFYSWTATLYIDLPEVTWSRPVISDLMG